MKDACRALETMVMHILSNYGGNLETDLNKVLCIQIGVFSLS
jgi:hypothetical protein